MTEMTHEMVAEQDLVMANITYRGIHSGAIHGIDATKTSVEVEEYLTCRIETREIIEFDWVDDTVSLLGQLGVELPIEA